MLNKPQMLAFLVAGGLTLVPAVAQETAPSHKADYVGLSCASVNALGPAAAAAFLFGYEAGFMDALDPEGPTSGVPTALTATASGTPPETTAIIVAACGASPDTSVAQALADRHSMEDPIELAEMMRSTH